jgi:phosphate transport system substrate-binding protein
MKNAVLAALVCLAATAATAATVAIDGAGATFPYPIYSKWFAEYNKVHPSYQINYQSIGSGGGIRQLANQTVFFGASDGPMTDAQLAAAPMPILHFPTVLGGVVPAYNLPGVGADLRLTGEALAGIVLGKIKKWNDPALVRDNPGVKLPDMEIVFVHRADGSGTTYIFVDYLSKVSPEFRQKVGVGTSVEWPVGVGGKGNEGVAGLVKQTPGALGYVELIYALPMVSSGTSRASGCAPRSRRSPPPQPGQRGRCLRISVSRSRTRRGRAPTRSPRSPGSCSSSSRRTRSALG